MNKPNGPAAPVSQDSAPFDPKAVKSTAKATPAKAELDLPHERDQEPNTSSTPDPMMVQAKKDLEAGLMDTELRTSAGVDAPNRPAGLTKKPKL